MPDRDDVYLDTTYCKARVNHKIVSRAVVVATGITEEGNREVLGVMVGDSETEVFWAAFLRSLRERGLTGVRQVISDSHSGLVKAIRKVLLGAGWQRCRVHFLRNCFAVIPREAAEMVAATIRTIFAQPDAEAVRARVDTVAALLRKQYPKVSEMPLEAKEDITTFADFPERHDSVGDLVRGADGGSVVRFAGVSGVVSRGGARGCRCGRGITGSRRGRC